MRRFYLSMLVICLCGPLQIIANSREDSLNRYEKLDTADRISATFLYKVGEVILDNGTVLTVPAGYRFLDAVQGRLLVERLWGNPHNPDFMGLLLPLKVGPMDNDVLGIEISADASGYLSESDANQLNYHMLLRQMKRHLREENIWRSQNGYNIVTAMKWAFPPYYHPEDNTLHLPRILHFAQQQDVLNYEMRILTRNGALCLTAIANVSQLAAVQQLMPEMVKKIRIAAGNDYFDFNPKTDQFATWAQQVKMVSRILNAQHFLQWVANSWLFLAVCVLLVLFVYTMQLFHRKRGSHRRIFHIDESLN